MTTDQIARRLVELCRAGQFNQAHGELYADHAESIEMDGVPPPLGSVRGLDAIREKGRRFDETYETMHGVTVSEPLVAGAFFSVVMGIDATWKQGGRRAFEEICVYETSGGKIVREQFFYRMG